jgi:hypothetical protein
MLLGLPVMAPAASTPGKSAAAEVTVAERVFVDRLRDLVQAKQWTEAARHIQQAQAIRPVPPWLAAHDGEVRLAQIRIGQAERDFPAVVAAARLFLNGDDARSQQVIDLARESHAAGDRNLAIALAREVVQRTPDFVPARQLLLEWDPPAPAKPVMEKTEPPAKPIAETRPVAPAATPEQDEPTVLLGRVRASREQGNVPAMLAAARLFLTGDRTRSFKLLEVAREYLDRGDTATALALTKEVLRRTPGFPPAERLMTEIERAEKK